LARCVGRALPEPELPTSTGEGPAGFAPHLAAQSPLSNWSSL
jgi:hypothetical protein